MSEINELREFHRFLGAKLENGGADLSPEEALDEWRDLHPEPWDDEDDVAAIQASIDDFNKGDTPSRHQHIALRLLVDDHGQRRHCDSHLRGNLIRAVLPLVQCLAANV